MREDKRIVAFEIFSRPFGEHTMPDLENPNKGTTALPKFLDGTASVRGPTTLSAAAAWPMWLPRRTIIILQPLW